MISFFRVIKFAIQGFLRNFWLSVVTITMILMALFSVTLLVTMNYVKQGAIEGIEKKVDILITMKSEVVREEVETMVLDLEDLPEVKKVTILTPEDNREIYKNSNLSEAAKKALEVFGEDENPFSYSLAVQAYSLDQYETILNFVNSEKYSQSVDASDFRDYEKFVAGVKNFADIINKYSWYLIAMFLLVAVVVIFNTIRISIYSRKNEMMIMKLVGADSWFVRAPFIIESILYAAVAIGLLIAIVYPLVNYLQPSLTYYFEDANVINLQNYFRYNFINIFGFQLLALIVINVASTMIAMRRYLKV